MCIVAYPTIHSMHIQNVKCIESICAYSIVYDSVRHLKPHSKKRCEKRVWIKVKQ